MIATIKDDEFAEVVKDTPAPVVPKEAVRMGDKGKVKKKIVLKNVKGEDMDEKDYFFGGSALPTFNDVCGMPVEREDLIEVFNKIFNVKDDILFYKTSDKEVYLVIVPIKNSTVIDESNESMAGDFQKHAISFIQEGSVNLETLKMRLRRIIPFLKFADR
jgi:hypothetical protein